MVGNLPFAVSISMLLQWLQALSERNGPFRFGRVPMTLVFQKEVGEVRHGSKGFISLVCPIFFIFA